MNIDQALEVALEYCWRHYPSYRKEGYTIENYKLQGKLQKHIIESFNRLVSAWGEDNIAPRDIHLLIETVAIARYAEGACEYFNYYTLTRK